MKNSVFQYLLDKWHNKKKELSAKKSNDYAGEDETLKNFKQMSAVLNAYNFKPPWTPFKFALIMQLMKIQRELNLIQDCKHPENEPLEDTESDKALYGDLGHACLVDEGLIKCVSGMFEEA